MALLGAARPLELAEPCLRPPADSRSGPASAPGPAAPSPPFAAEREAFDERLERLGARALLVLAESSRDPALAPFAGPGRLGSSLVVWARGQGPRLGYFSPMERGEAARSGLPLLTPERLDVERAVRDGVEPSALLAAVVERALHLSSVAPGTVAITGHQPSGRLHAALSSLAESGWRFVCGAGLVDGLRKRKGAGEIEAVRLAAAGTRAAFRRVARVLSRAQVEVDGSLAIGGGPERGQPLDVAYLKSAVAVVFAEHGLEQPERNIIAPAEEGAVPHTTGTSERVLRAGESLVVDLFPRGRLFADCTRTFCVGEPGPALAAGYAEVLAALEAAEAAARPGVRGWDLQVATCEQFRAAGWPTPVHDPGTQRGYVHGLGHGVGYELHELPSFRLHASDEEGMLETGDIITLEPGLYEPGPVGHEPGWAVRIEDLYLVTENGVENLTSLPRELDPRAW